MIRRVSKPNRYSGDIMVLGAKSVEAIALEQQQDSKCAQNCGLTVRIASLTISELKVLVNTCDQGKPTPKSMRQLWAERDGDD